MSEQIDIQIRGGAGPYEAAAVASVIHATLMQEEAARSRRPDSHLPPAWIRLGMPRPFGDAATPILPDAGRNWPDD